MNYWKDKEYWKDKVERWDYTDEQRNTLALRTYVDYLNEAKPLKELIKEHDTTTTSK